MKIERLLRAASLFEQLAKQAQLHPPWNPATQDYYTGSGGVGDAPHTYQDYETPKLTPLDYGDQSKPESPYVDAPGETDGSYTDWKPQYYRNIDPTYQQTPAAQAVSQKQPKEPLPQYLMRVVNTLKSNKQLNTADAGLWKQSHSTLKARWEQLKRLQTLTTPQQQERDMLAFVFGKMGAGITA